ncbi:unnamed protein product [Peronospora farinosa]|uniref:PDZ domain-containing protein n=1 Tax=Peronospora farinosa TaxID=134698 RepID=A0ABN8C7F3_9STRA|nr:unnamed protein product [Peronospora farinosa]
MGKYRAIPPKYYHLQHIEHNSLLLSRGETYALSDDTHEEGGDDVHGVRYGTAQAYADAFRAKLQEPPLSPRSKFNLLSSRMVTDNSMTPTESSDTSGSHEEEKVEGRAGFDPSLQTRKQYPQAWNSFSCQDDIGDNAMDNDEESPIVTSRGAPIVNGFVRKYNGRKSTIENSSLVQKGSVLCAINDIDVTHMPLKEVIRTLNLSSHLERVFTFRNGFQHRNSM